MWKWLLGLLVISAVACGIGGYFFTKSPQFDKVMRKLAGEKPPKEVRLEPVRRGTLIRSVSAPGSVEAKTSVKISAQVSARIVGLPFREGDDVKKDDIVVQLDARDLQAELESAQASLARERARLDGTKAMLARATMEVERQRRLAESHDVAPTVLESAEAEFLRAESELKATEQAIEIAKANIQRAAKDLDNTVIRAPIEGTITRLGAEVGELVVIGTLNNAASVIMEIADLSSMRLEARVDETAIAPVAVGQNALIYINAYTELSFKGRVERVGLQRLLDQNQSGYFEVLIELDIPEKMRLKTGLTANTDIQVETTTDALKVPSQAVVDRRVDELPRETTEAASAYLDRTKAFTRVVYVLADGKAKAVPVSVGASDLTHTVITAGLSEGDRVITGPFRVLTDVKNGDVLVEEKTEAEKRALAEKGQNPREEHQQMRDEVRQTGKAQ